MCSAVGLEGTWAPVAASVSGEELLYERASSLLS